MSRIVSHSEKETSLLAKNLAQLLKGGEVLALYGKLGSGKTTFIKGLARGLGLKQQVRSPSFVILSSYKLPGYHHKTFYHLDLYRLKRKADLIELGVSEILHNPNSIVAIEWAELARGLLPQYTIPLKFSHGKTANERIIQIWSWSKK